MDIYQQIKDYLRQGSFNRPGSDAAAFLALQLRVKKSAVVAALRKMSQDGEVDLGHGTPSHTSYVALNRQDYRPRSERFRRESIYAVDPRGRHYSGRKNRATPVVERRATLDEWVRMGNNAEDYPFTDPDPVPEPARTYKPPATGRTLQRKLAQLMDIIEHDEMLPRNEGLINRESLIFFAKMRMKAEDDEIVGYLKLLLQKNIIKLKRRGRYTYYQVAPRTKS